MTKTPFKGKPERSQNLLDLIHTDVCGPFSIGTKYGHTYFITFTDDYSRYGYLYLMKYKSESFDKFKEFKTEVENQLGKSIKALRSDRGGEYLSAEFLDYLKQNGILSQWTPPATPQLNGVAERRNRTLLDMVRSMMSFTELPLSFWGYALETAVMLLNNVHSKAVNKTPYELWMGRPPKYSYLRIWGCPAYVKQAVGGKLDSRSTLCYFVGYPKNSVGYYFYHPTETKVFVSRNATFLEKEFLLDRKGKMIELEEIREGPETQTVEPTPQEPIVIEHAPRRSERMSRPPIRYGLLLEGDQCDPTVGCDPRNFKEAISDADANLWL
ncbi:DDE-type integrase/transposase/recombinase, partial [Pediococcus pentosaceus]|uniref:DDE-type integrase/transposase/recombinase n=1 Tax=Pediococcus pentosaceus TaxID=1255 RepID=UPI00055E03A1